MPDGNGVDEKIALRESSPVKCRVRRPSCQFSSQINKFSRPSFCVTFFRFDFPNSLGHIRPYLLEKRELSGGAQLTIKSHEQSVLVYSLYHTVLTFDRHNAFANGRWSFRKDSHINFAAETFV